MKSASSPRTGDAAVMKATGKNWAEWFGILDRKKATSMSHKDIAQWIYDNHEISGWWSQEVTVMYEKERGMREDHQKGSEYEISVSRTINCEVAKLYKLFSDPRARRKWLKEKIDISTRTENKSIRASWEDGTTRISVNFYPKPNGKTMVSVQHLKLADGKSAEKMKSFWSDSLGRLKSAAE